MSHIMAVDKSAQKIKCRIATLVCGKMTNTGMPENELKTLAELHKEASEIQLKIRRLLLQNYSYDDGIADQLTKISVISDLRQKFIAIEKEIRLRADTGE